MRRQAVLTAVLFLAAACAGTPSPPSTPGQRVEPYVTSAELCGKLPSAVPELPAQQSAVPADVDVSWVLECVVGPPAQSGTPHVKVLRADGPVPELLAALRQPSATEVPTACTAEYLLPFYLALVTSDARVIAPVIPVDGCAKPRPEVLKALGDLPFQPIK